MFAGDAGAQRVARRRAVLVGINDYTATHIPEHSPKPVVPPRDWPNLGGAVNDVGHWAAVLELLYGFDRRDIVVLTDQKATREAIVNALENHLANSPEKDDVLFFYFAGHGSQVRNSQSDEKDGLDESIVPADSRRGALDIRDKDLRRIFNRILDHGARLTVLIDACHSGSGVRGLPTGAHPRGIRADERDVADPGPDGPRPEDRGALVLSASQDFDNAWEMRDAEGRIHGAFSWAWLRAIRDAMPGESASETFARAEARLHAEMPFQQPLLAGDEARRDPFLGVRTDRRGDRTVAAVERVRKDGTVVLNGGWANGISVGCELRVTGDPRVTTRLTITSLIGLGRSEARLSGSVRSMPQAVSPGALLEVVGWAAPPAKPLQVWTPSVAIDAREIHSTARKLAAEAARRGIHWISDPTETWTHVLRRGNLEWELLTQERIERLGADSADAVAALSRVPAGASLFVQLPVSAALLDGIGLGPGTDREGIVPTQNAEDADYILVGRYSGKKLSYAWVRPRVSPSDQRRSGLPMRTAWVVDDGRDETRRHPVSFLRDAVLRLRRIHGWQLLESPPQASYPYHLALHRERTNDWASDAVIGDDRYRLVLRAATSPLPARVPQRYVYVFVVDSHGRSVLLFPSSGSVENRLPAPPPAAEIPLEATCEITPPYGVDTYFLLTTDVPLSDPWILEWDGVRAAPPPTANPLERLLQSAGSPRATRLVTPSTWSIDKTFFESVPPPASSNRPSATP